MTASRRCGGLTVRRGSGSAGWIVANCCVRCGLGLLRRPRLTELFDDGASRLFKRFEVGQTPTARGHCEVMG